MPWQMVSTVVEQRVQFVADYQRRRFPSFSELCRRYGISRETGYETIARYDAWGRAGLAARSRRPRCSPSAIADEIVEALVAKRTRFPDFGPKKLLEKLRQQDAGVLERARTNTPEADWPAVSTAALILKRNGLVKERRRRHGRPRRPDAVRHMVAAQPNDVWTTDFKGQFLTGDARYCYPLTVRDRCSRYLLECHGLLAPEMAPTIRRFERVFRDFGLPLVILSDNGVPFASTAVAGLSQLSVWWVRLGIQLDRIRPGCPDENGSHEYMHRVLKRNTARPPAGTCASQQRRFDAFKLFYNDERPHEALGMKVPSEVYVASARAYPTKLPPVEYPGHFEVRKVISGCFNWHSQPVFLSHTLNDLHIGLEAIDDAVWAVYFCRQPIGRFDERTNRVTDTHERYGFHS